MSTEPLQLTVAGGIATIAINRPEKRNAMSLSMWRDLSKYVAACADDPDVLAIVLRGGEAAFASGADLEEILRVADSDVGRWELMNAVRAAEQSLVDCPKPSIAMIRGICIGGGVELALGCDLRFAAETARFAIPPAKLGLVYSLSSTRHLIELVGLGRARDLLYSARAFDAAEALSLGLVERVFDDGDLERETLAYVQGLAMRSQYSIRAAKAISASAMTGGTDDDQAVREIRGNAFSGEDLREGLAAFAVKRSPRFTWR